MITILRSTDTGLEKIETLADGSWVNLVNPSPEDVGLLSQEYRIPSDMLTSALDLDETARMEKEEEALLIVLRVPQHQGPTADIPYATVPLGIILTERVIVTVCKVASPIIEELVASHPRGLSTTKRSRFFLVLFLVAAKKFLLHLREINRNVDSLEDKLQLSLRNREVLELLKYQKSLTYFTTALKANELMMGRLQKGRLFRMYPEDEDLLDDVLTEIGQAQEMTAISSGILSQMMDAFASIISNNLNVVMKFLTSVTILLALPTLIASIYGMNISLPFEHLPWPARTGTVVPSGAPKGCCAKGVGGPSAPAGSRKDTGTVCARHTCPEQRVRGGRGPNGVRRKGTRHEGHCISAIGFERCLRFASSDSFTAPQHGRGGPESRTS